MIKKIAHVGIATESIGVVSEFYKLLGLEMDAVEVVKDQNVKVAMMKVGESAVELIEPLGEESPVARFIDKRGEGIHHMTFEVEDIEAVLNRLKDSNIRLVDETPRQGAEGNLIAFIHPDSTGGVLIELCQTQSSHEDES
ncbi:MAG TPA: methylmalonyl-CoA epimerase [Acidobacteriota bacterium]|nr:methylmalonyl-CoA epimerase [Acidobacteriota bacterium]